MMTAYLKSKFFLQVFLTSLVACFILLAGINFYLNTINDKTAIDDFVLDSKYLAAQSTQVLKNTPQEWTSFKELSKHYFHFIPSVISEEKRNELIKNHDPIYLKNNVIVLHNDTNDFLSAIYPLFKNSYLLINESGSSSYSQNEEFKKVIARENERENTNTRVIFLSILGFISIFAISLLYSIYKIVSYIKILEKTSQKFYEGDLQARMPNNLPQPLSKLSTAFNNMAEQLEQSIIEKDIVSGAISHELRTPLTKLQLANEIALKKDSNNELLKNINSYINELKYLTEHVLLLSKLGNNNYQPTAEKIDLLRFIKDRCEALQGFNKEQRIVDIKEPNISIMLSANHFLLQILLDNLIKNALIYSHSHIKITTLSADNNVTIYVEDDGDGIPTDDYKTIFIPFYRLEKSRNKELGGHGLGLAICKKIINRLNGEISIEKSNMGGANFILKLPFVQ